MPMTQNVSAGAFGLATMPPGSAIAGNGASGPATAAATQAAGPQAPAIWWAGIAILLVGIRLLHERYGASLD